MEEPRVSASPTKSFFVSTLTRDIELKDAILDLLDNCVDGILRSLKEHPPKDAKKPYKDYFAKIELSKKSFSIEDNCGGISKDLLVKSVFQLGRPDQDRDADLPTVGMYGIGMKRAIFKMGQSSSVYTRHAGDTYLVEISPDWLKDDENWFLPLQKVDHVLKEDGTRVMVSDLYDPISERFGTKNFIDDLHTDIANFFAMILDKGFNVYVNGQAVIPIDFKLLMSDDFLGVQPYAFQGNIDGVDVEIVIGFYREPPKITEVDETEEEERDLPLRKSENAGWTVICNDRVILDRDRTHITGWGVRDVPRYHTQFIAISGVVKFNSNESFKLPLSTTKRNLDTTSRVYGIVLNYMMEGLKQFTNFTNYWKGREKETADEFVKMRRAEPSEIIEKIPEKSWGTVRGTEGKARKFVPNLPKPAKDNEKRRIAFYKSIAEISILSEYFYGVEDTLPSEVGEKCFDEALKTAKRSRK